MIDSINKRLLYLIPAVFVLAACQQPGQISENSGVSSLKIGDYEPIQDDVASDDDNNDNTAGLSQDCTEFLSASQAIDLEANQDVSLVGQSGQSALLNGIRDLIVNSVSGNLTVLSAINASVENVSGSLHLNAQNISKIQNVSGNICIRAKNIGSMSNGSGNNHIVAESVDSLTVQSGNFHVYGAVIKMAHAVSGNICLHDGAQILQLSATSGHVKTDCK